MVALWRNSGILGILRIKRRFVAVDLGEKPWLNDVTLVVVERQWEARDESGGRPMKVNILSGLVIVALCGVCLGGVTVTAVEPFEKADQPRWQMDGAQSRGGVHSRGQIRSKIRCSVLNKRCGG